ncbi:hypothetical protein DFH07DRAFT_766971 [Mycena maculata]|uniref:Uncharacterized protein n=1 Tax=Mycena maculata TaxID=230809 RepID=A0AAD7K0Z0_9AGAR|nr:hypothetical protein DFH07DRAFT_766971 [Mycena maculata]
MWNDLKETAGHREQVGKQVEQTREHLVGAPNTLIQDPLWLQWYGFKTNSEQLEFGAEKMGGKEKELSTNGVWRRNNHAILTPSLTFSPGSTRMLSDPTDPWRTATEATESY